MTRLLESVAAVCTTVRQELGGDRWRDALRVLMELAAKIEREDYWLARGGV